MLIIGTARHSRLMQRPAVWLTAGLQEIMSGSRWVLVQVLCQLHHGNGRDERRILGCCLCPDGCAAARNIPEALASFCMARPQQHNWYVAYFPRASLIYHGKESITLPTAYPNVTQP